MTSDRIKEIQNFSNEFLLKLQHSEECNKNPEDKHITIYNLKLKKSNSTICPNTNLNLQTDISNILSNSNQKRNRRPKKNKSSHKLSEYKVLLPWIPPRYVGKYFENFKRLQDKHDLSNLEKHRIHLCERSYQKEELLPLKKNFICKKLYNYELNKFPNNNFTVEEATKNLAPYGQNLIKVFINENEKREKEQRLEEEKLFIYKHSKPPLKLNKWKFSNHVIEEFSRPKADEIYGYREKKKPKYDYTVEPFRRPKEQGDYFDKHIGIL